MPPRHLRAVTALLASCALIPALLLSTPAHACGGFFCSQVPVEQRGEQIIFGFERGKVTAIIQIAYQGSAEDFAWIVPVEGTPGIALGPDSLFDTLRQQTDPYFRLDWDYDNSSSCEWMMFDSAPTGAAESGDDSFGAGGVTILDKQVVGPFEAVTLTATGADVLLDWLNQNDYDQPPESLPLIEHYLKLEMNFVAVKLLESAAVGDLQPLMLELDAPGPCVPLVLTRIAAAPDMPVTLWTFGETRTIPTNWFGVDVNLRKIDWFDNGSNYEKVATMAIDEAAGHGFITEYAKPMRTQYLVNTNGLDTAYLSTVTSPIDFLQEMLNQGFPRNAQAQTLIQQFIPKPAEEALPDGCKEDREFYTWNMDECITYMPADWTFDSQGFAAALEEKVVAPMVAVDRLLDTLTTLDTDGDGQADSSYLTRLFTTVSDHEMTRDPMFDFNPDLPEVSNERVAKVSATCDPDDPGMISSATLTVGGISWDVEGPIPLWGGGGGDFLDPVPTEASASEIVVYGTSGPAEVVVQWEGSEVVVGKPGDVAQREQAFEMMDPTHIQWDGEVPESNVVDPATPATPTSSSSSGGCAGSAPLSSLLWLISCGVIALLPLRRRRT